MVSKTTVIYYKVPRSYVLNAINQSLGSQYKQIHSFEPNDAGKIWTFVFMMEDFKTKTIDKVIVTANDIKASYQMYSGSALQGTIVSFNESWTVGEFFEIGVA